MKKAFLMVSVILGLALCPLQADDYVDDAYYWDGVVSVSPTKSSAAKASSNASGDAVTTTVKKVPAAVQQPAPQKATEPVKKVQSTNRPVTPKVEFIQVQDTVVKAVIHRKNQ